MENKYVTKPSIEVGYTLDSELVNSKVTISITSVDRHNQVQLTPELARNIAVQIIIAADNISGAEGNTNGK